jgi:hypothetical protein
MNKFRNYHKGELGFVCSNGEYFNNININKLYGYPIFITDIALLKKVAASYYVTHSSFFESKDFEQFKFIYNVKIINVEYVNNYKFKLEAGKPFFQTDINKPIWNSGSSLFTAIQLTYFMGINPVILVGLDYDSNLINSPLELALSLANDEFNKDERYIYNASSLTRLSYNIIPKISLDIFKD